MKPDLSFDRVQLTFYASVAVMSFFGRFSGIELLQLGYNCITGKHSCPRGEVIFVIHLALFVSGTPMALKFFPRQSTSLTSFLREYNLSLSYCTHPSLTRALGIFFSTPTYYVFAQQAGLYGDLYNVIVSEVSLAAL